MITKSLIRVIKDLTKLGESFRYRKTIEQLNLGENSFVSNFLITIADDLSSTNSVSPKVDASIQFCIFESRDLMMIN